MTPRCSRGREYVATWRECGRCSEDATRRCASGRVASVTSACGCW